MAEQYAPGTVAMSKYGHVFKTESGWVFDDHDGPASGCPQDLRPLLVIDPEDREEVARLAANLDNRIVDDTDMLQAALRSLLTPPKPAVPECPEGCVTVVDAIECVWSVRDGGYWETANSIKALTWAELIHSRGPLRPVGPVLSAGIGEAE